MNQSEPPRSDDDLPAEWQGVLETGESILWQGSPENTDLWTPIPSKALVIAAILFPMALAADYVGEIKNMQATVALLFWSGVSALVYQGLRYWDRRRCFYTLTNRRAFIGTWHFGIQELKSYDLLTATPLVLKEQKETALWFATETRRRDGVSEVIDIGFRGLSNPREPWQVILDLRAKEADHDIT